MAVDEALAEAVAAGTSAPVLRLYRWHPPCLSLGASQPFSVADADFCGRHGVDLVRRPTGGRAVLHHHELTYLVAAPLGECLGTRELQGAYAAICRALVAGLRRLGVDARLADAVPAAGLIRPTQAVPCFIGPAPGEVTAGGRKLVGSAMRRVGNAILQHGSILEDWDGALQAGCLGLTGDAGLRAAVVTLAELVDDLPTPQALATALQAGFAEVLEAHFEPGALTEAERARAETLVRERYGSPAWTVKRRWAVGGAILTPLR